MNYSNSTQPRSMSRAILTGWGMSVVITVLLAFAAAYAVSAEFLDETKIGYIIMLITGTSVALGSFITIRKVETKLLLSALAVGSAYYATMLLAGLSLFGGLKGSVVVTGILVVGCSGCVSLLSLKGKKQRYTPTQKYRNR